MHELVTFGETMALFAARRTGPLRFARDFDLGLGGAESNVAIGVARLGHRVVWVGRVGADEFGDLIRATLAGEGVDARAIPDPDAPTGLMIKGRRTADLIDVRYYRKGSAGSRLCAADLDPELIRSARVLHVSAITPALSEEAREAVRHAVAVARGAGVLVSLDVNYRRALWTPEEAGAWLRDMAADVDVLFATEEEGRLIADVEGAEKLASALAELGPRHVLIKLGARGAMELSDGVLLRSEPYRVTEVDSVGAGDAFAAGWLADWLAGADPAERLSTACAAGAFAVTSQGDWESLPRRSDLGLLRHSGDGVSR
ncbi:sugar kinase [Nonomuraea phyllanthi]|uniref:Sugar kinase n=1 Tax=Nonomuraea phyllanthi TaxID=2219224 RepID=A0A5C4WES2_9ACTN|nr:sugar kinase [Nonomuraea phyllanthi]KAB8193543.1 sugar kinase [Nonomuraea phyllanthi]QFY12284.1 sugar kinase [Nonomuraea phyllanthi]